MKKADKYLIGVICAAVLLTGGFFMFREPGKQVVIYQDTVEIGRYDLEKEQEIEVFTDEGGWNQISWKDGKVQVTDASCPDQVCVDHIEISKEGETIVCLPNKLVVEIQ